MAPPPKKIAGAPAKREIVAVAQFSSPWTSLKEEVDALDAGSWNPSDQDMRAVAFKDAKKNDIFDIATFGEFLGAINDAQNGTLERLVLITHSNSSLIAFSGTMSYNGTKGNVGLNGANSSNYLNSGGLDQNVVNWFNTDPTGRAQRDNARTKFTPNGEVVFVSCHAGGSVFAPPLFLMDFAGALNVTVRAFTKDIRYTPDYVNNPNPAKVKMNDRSITAVSGSTPDKGFRHLLIDPDLRSIKSPSPIP